jgi:pre-mRNA-splicing factor ATP-dependent RNA helicase DHX38/PRP16
VKALSFYDRGCNTLFVCFFLLALLLHLFPPLLITGIMADSTGLDQFINELAIEISQKIGLHQPNQILTKRIIQLSQSKTGDTLTSFAKNVKSFGRFDEAYITSLWDKLSSRDDLSALSSSIDLSANPSQGLTNGLNLTGDGKQVVPQMVIQDRDLLQPSSSPAPGGLSIPNKQHGSLRVGKEDVEKHVFKAPQPARASELGLDRLAMRKRAEKLLIDERESKKPRPENGSNSEDHPEFKGSHTNCHQFMKKMNVLVTYDVQLLFSSSAHSTSLSTVQSTSKA